MENENAVVLTKHHQKINLYGSRSNRLLRQNSDVLSIISGAILSRPVLLSCNGFTEVVRFNLEERLVGQVMFFGPEQGDLELERPVCPAHACPFIFSSISME